MQNDLICPHILWDYVLEVFTSCCPRSSVWKLWAGNRKTSLSAKHKLQLKGIGHHVTTMTMYEKLLSRKFSPFTWKDIFFNDKEHITFVLRNCWGNDWIHTNQNLQQSWRGASITVLRGSTFSPLHWDMLISLWFYGALWFHLYLQCLLRPIGTCWSVWGGNAQPKQEDWAGEGNGHRCQRYRGHVLMCTT